MRRNQYALAALVTAALPQAKPVQVSALNSLEDDGIDRAGVVDESGARYVVAAPRNPAAGVTIEAELHIAQALAGSELGALIEEPLATVKLDDNARAIVSKALAGHPIAGDELAAEVDLAKNLGLALAKLHSVPTYIAQSAGVEEFSAHQIHEQWQKRFQRGLDSGNLPAAVAERWQKLLQDESLWQFTPTFVHGDLAEENILALDTQIAAILNWSSAHVGDPAKDLAWAISMIPGENFEEFARAYQLQRERPNSPTKPDAKIFERASLVSEFAILDWLLHGLDTDDADVIADANAMLDDLDYELTQAAQAEAEAEYNQI